MNRRPRILVVAPGGSIFTGPFIRTFERMGFECAVFDHRQGLVFTSVPIRKAMHAFPMLKFLKRLKIEQTNRALLSLVRSFSPDYLIGQKAESIGPETICAIRKLGVVTINFYNDFINQWDGIRRLAPAYDFFFTPDHYVLKKLEQEGLKNCHYLPFAVEPRNNQEGGLCARPQYDIGFVGTYNPAVYHDRERYLMAVRDLGLHIWGSDGWADSPLRAYFHGRARGDDRFEIYRLSKIVIDVNFNEWPCDAMSMRPFEVGCAGACLFSDTIRADLARTFEPNRAFIPFSNPAELREKVAYYLSHDDERRRIAQTLNEDVMAHHTYDERMRKMFDIINGGTGPAT